MYKIKKTIISVSAVFFFMITTLKSDALAISNGSYSKNSSNSASKIKYSKLIGYVVSENNGKFICGQTTSSATTDVKPCPQNISSAAIAQVPNGASADVKTAAAGVIVGAAVLCFAGGAIIQSSYLMENQNGGLSWTLYGLGTLKKGEGLWKALVAFANYSAKILAQKTIPGTVAFMAAAPIGTIAATIAVCEVSSQIGEHASRKIYYLFSRNKNDIQ